MGKESTDKHLALLSYRTTPLPWCGMSPAELSQGRRLRSDIPQPKDNLIPQWPFISDLQRKDREFKLRQKKNFDRRHRVRPLPDIPEETDVWINTHGHQSQGQIRNRANAPRSYVIDTPTGTIRRNRSQLNIIPDQRTPSSSMSSREPILTRSRTGTTIADPKKGRCGITDYIDYYYYYVCSIMHEIITVNVTICMLCISCMLVKI